MNRKSLIGAGLLAVTIIGVTGVTAAQNKNGQAKTGQATSLTGEGEALRAAIIKALPEVDAEKKAAFDKARQEEMAAIGVVEKTQGEASSHKTTNKAEVAKSLKAADEALVRAQAKTMKIAQALLAQVEPFLASDKLDANLTKCAVLVAQHAHEQGALVPKLLSDNDLMKQMLVAGGAEGGMYGRAMEIYTAIQKASSRAGTGELQRLALGVALEHAVPVPQKNEATATGAPTIVDPVKRYLHYEKAYLDGELDPAFKDLSVWEYRMVVNSDAPDNILAWGREMLRNYRPDEIYNPNYGWRYSASVKTEVKYGGEKEYKDSDSLNPYQNIIKTGGVCGRRAFFGRYILRSFGIPVWGVTQHGHAALSHWTPKGWVVNLGAGFRWGWWDKADVPQSGIDFLLETQARAVPQEYLKVLRAQWISAVLGEQSYNDRKGVAGGFWSAVAHYEAKAIVAASKTVELGPLGQDIAEANHSKEVEVIEKVKIPEADKKIVVGSNGVITIPAVACSNPKNSTKTIVFMKSYTGGGMQLHWNRLGHEEEFDYTFDAPQAGKYALAAKVVTVNAEQKLLVTHNGETKPIVMEMPYTTGMWQKTEPVVVTLVRGQNILHFTRKEPYRGLTIKEFTLTPVK